MGIVSKTKMYFEAKQLKIFKMADGYGLILDVLPVFSAFKRHFTSKIEQLKAAVAFR